MAWSFDEGPRSKRSDDEAKGSLRLTRRVLELVEGAVAERRMLHITPEFIVELHSTLMCEIAPEHAGQYRTTDLEILGSKHVPPPFADVPRLIEEVCVAASGNIFDARANELALAATMRDETGKEWTDVSMLGSAAFWLWRLNWIHPFHDGNGRVARAIAYATLCCECEMVLPGRVTMPERILHERAKYYRCLEEADRAWKRGRANVSHLDGFLERLLRAQLRDAEAES